MKEDSKEYRQKQRFIRGLSKSAADALGIYRKSEEHPKALRYFTEILEKIFIRGETPPMESPDQPPRAVGIYCMMVPEELIYAAGAIPLRLCGGSYHGALMGDRHVPRDACPVVKASVGHTQTGYPAMYSLCDTVIVPTTCDAKRKMAEELSRFTNVLILEVPHLKENPASMSLWRSQVDLLKHALEKLSGRKITSKSLSRGIEIMRRARYQANRLYEMRKSVPPVIRGQDAMLAMHTFGLLNAPDWTRAMKTLNDELEDQKKNNQYAAPANMPRIIICSSPSIFPNIKIPALLEEAGMVVVVADESCAGDRYLYDTVVNSENALEPMLTALSARYFMPCACPSFSPNRDRGDRLVQMAEAYKVDGVIYYVLKGCVLYDFEFTRIEEALKTIGVPVLRVESDYNPEDIEQLRTRFEAFSEMLSAPGKSS